jgi:hypothetical protein
MDQRFIIELSALLALALGIWPPAIAPWNLR